METVINTLNITSTSTNSIYKTGSNGCCVLM